MRFLLWAGVWFTAGTYGFFAGRLNPGWWYVLLVGVPSAMFTIYLMDRRERYK